MKNMEIVKKNIYMYLVGRKEPVSFHGKYLGHKRPNGKETKNWHYYESSDGKIYHFRKEHIQYVISMETLG